MASPPASRSTQQERPEETQRAEEERKGYRHALSITWHSLTTIAAPQFAGRGHPSHRRDGFTGTEKVCSSQLFSRACSAPPGAQKDEDISKLLLPHPGFYLTCHLRVRCEVTLQFLSLLSPCWLQS